MKLFKNWSQLREVNVARLELRELTEKLTQQLKKDLKPDVNASDWINKLEAGLRRAYTLGTKA